MAWTPTPDIDAAVSRLIVRAREGAIGWAAEERDRLTSDLSRRGLLQSGAFLMGKEKLASQELERVGRAAISDVLQFFTQVFGAVPVESMPWIRDTLGSFIDRFANSLGTEAAADRQRQQVDPRGADEQIRRTAIALKRDLDIALAPLEIRAKLAQLTPPEREAQPSAVRYDAFICHASEDKNAVAVPLAERLKAAGYRVWLDRFELKVGDRLLEKIDEGILSSRFGVVILSPQFFAKKWTKRELAGLAAREDAEDRPMILPIRFEISQSQLASLSPTLAAILGVDWSEGIESVMAKLIAVLGRPE
jgi:TIR domain-containing protein